MGITVLAQSATIDGLRDHGVPPHPLSEPPCALRQLDVPMTGIGANRTGIWESAPGKFRRVATSAEVMHVLSGSMTFTPTVGEAVTVRAGDSLFFSSNTLGEWEVHETVRKLFVVFPA
jgi:uncharacterized cupin superfamily protein